MLKRRQRVYYGMGRFGSQVLLSFIDLAAFWIYIDRFGLNPIFSAIGFSLGKLIIAISGPLIGYFSDITWTNRWGRRKIFFIFGAPSLAISCALAFVPNWFISPGNQLGLLIYMIGAMAIFNFFYALLMTPYQAWMPEITEPEERVAVSTYQNGFWLMGQIVGTIGGFALPMLLSIGQELVFIMISWLGVIAVFCFVPVFISLKEKKQAFVPQPGLRMGFQHIFSNQNYRFYLVLQCAMGIPTTMLGRLVLFYAEDVLGLIDLQFIIIGLILMFATFAFYFVWMWMSKRKGGKRAPLLMSLTVLTIILPFTLIIGQPILATIPSIVQGTLFIGLIAAGVSGWYLLPNPITADIIDEDESRTSEGRAGGYEGFINFPINIVQIMGTMLVGFLLILPIVPPNTYSLGLLIWGPIAALFVAISIALVWKLVDTDPLQATK
ncbi:MAG: MFS transporter [Promethearchaeota archaeon]